MTENRQPALHGCMKIIGDEIAIVDDRYALSPTVFMTMSPDAAVALGYALFENGLFLKGKMKPTKENPNG